MPLERYSAGVDVFQFPDGSWHAEMQWERPGFQSIGEIRTFLAHPTLGSAIDQVMEMANEFGIRPFPHQGTFELSYRWDKWPRPDGWEKMLSDEARRRGWRVVL